ncbi:hypothetical protein PR048_007435 [Dryococelus australis]|uniref:Uncharacterized protein n=1 Tax=Dryococelus australis TaxID=614101 RepID=A0ABQ9HUC2_9NEOP|nr:hypothetical protein PR048_007435 [Dryococelus australis]
MLRRWLVVQLRNLGIADDYWFQQDGAPPYCPVTVRAYLKEIFPGRWIGRGTPHQHTLGLHEAQACANALWGMVKQKVSKTRYETTDQLKDSVRTAFRSITPQMLRTLNGAHADMIDI